MSNMNKKLNDEIENANNRKNDDIIVNDFDGCFNIIYLNARSLRNKIDKIQLLINSFGDHVVDVLVITETWMKSGEESIFELNGYKSLMHCVLMVLEWQSM